jgi:hypothetical protein
MGIETLCKDCVFAEYEDKVQINCKIGQLDVLTDAGASTVQVTEDDKTFFIIHDVFCMYWRDKGWLSDRRHLNDEKLKSIARKEMRIHYEAIIYANDSLADLQVTVESLKNQSIPPKRITVIRYNDNRLRPPQIVQYLQTLENIAWANANRINDGRDLDSLIHSASTNEPIAAVFNAGFVVPDGLFEELDIKVNDQYLRFALILPNSSGNGMILSTYIFKAVGGNFNGETGEYDRSFESKIKETKWESMIYQINKQFASFPQ